MDTWQAKQTITGRTQRVADFTKSHLRPCLAEKLRKHKVSWVRYNETLIQNTAVNPPQTGANMKSCILLCPDVGSVQMQGLKQLYACSWAKIPPNQHARQIKSKHSLKVLGNSLKIRLVTNTALSPPLIFQTICSSNTTQCKVFIKTLRLAHFQGNSKSFQNICFSWTLWIWYLVLHVNSI